MKSLGIEVRVGVFVLAALTLLVGFVLVLGNFSFSPEYTLHADFAYSGDLQVGAPVRVSGIRVGRVSDLRILTSDANPPSAGAATGELGRSGQPVIRASLAVDESARSLFTEDAQFFVGTQGIIGEAYVEVTPGTFGAPLIAEGASVRGVDAPRLHVMALQIAAVLDSLGALADLGDEAGLSGLGRALALLLGSIGDILGERRHEIAAAIDDIAAVAENLRQVSASLRQALGDGRQLGSLIDDGRETVGGLRDDLPLLITHANDSLTAVEDLTRRASRAVEPHDVEAIVADMRQTMAHLKKTALDARKMMDTIRRGQGSVGGLVTDPQVYDDLKEMLRDLKRHPWKLFWRD
jgi:phospholipid/cholesterol/gamma-HCH transport system substrate-binding protein